MWASLLAFSAVETEALRGPKPFLHGHPAPMGGDCQGPRRDQLGLGLVPAQRAIGGQEPPPRPARLNRSPRGGRAFCPRASRAARGAILALEAPGNSRNPREIPGHQLPRKLARGHPQDGPEARAKMALGGRRTAPSGRGGEPRATRPWGRGSSLPLPGARRPRSRRTRVGTRAPGPAPSAPPPPRAPPRRAPARPPARRGPEPPHWPRAVT